MDIDPEARERLASVMEARRLDLGLSWIEVATKGGLSTEILRKLRASATSIRPLTLRKLDTALGWPTGTAEGILRDDQGADVADDRRRTLAALDLLRQDVEAGRITPGDAPELIKRYVRRVTSGPDAGRDEHQLGA